MRSAAPRLLCFSAVLLLASAQGGAQERPAKPDPRVGLKPGFRDAGQVARNMELMATLPKPDGFFDPKAPAGIPTPPERAPGAAPGTPEGGAPAAPEGGVAAATGAPATAGEASGARGAAPEGQGGAPGGRGNAGAGLNFSNSDLAFSRNHVIIGNFNGFNTYDVDSTKRPKLLASVVCPGGQGDVSIHGNLLFMSVEQTRGRIDCGTEGVQDTVSKERFRGIRIFDISDLRKPKQIAAVQTCRGSHTHTLVTDPKDKTNVYVYGSVRAPSARPKSLLIAREKIRRKIRTRRSSASM